MIGYKIVKKIHDTLFSINSCDEIIYKLNQRLYSNWTCSPFFLYSKPTATSTDNFRTYRCEYIPFNKKVNNLKYILSSNIPCMIYSLENGYMRFFKNYFKAPTESLKESLNPLPYPESFQCLKYLDVNYKLYVKIFFRTFWRFVMLPETDIDYLNDTLDNVFGKYGYSKFFMQIPENTVLAKEVVLLEEYYGTTN